MIRRLSEGLGLLSASDDHRQTALKNLRLWLTDPQFHIYREQLQSLIGSQQWSVLLDCFYRVLPFGTGGRRGPVGIGTNRYNPWTLASSVRGHVDYLREHHQGDLSVVIAYDVRVFLDLHGVYDPDLPNPLRSITSRDFARIAAGVYVAQGVRVHMLPDDASTYMSTPELSFAIRRLSATAGLNISASHNHPDDNGGKFYNQLGGQEVPPDDQEMSDLVRTVEEVTWLDFEAAKATGLICWVDPSVHRQYVATNVSQCLTADQRGARIVFSPLHGTGATTVQEVLVKAGFAVDVVAEQATADGAFPNVPYRAPNPEVTESMRMGMDRAADLGADLVMACDPDADRIGVCSPAADGTYQFLTGNEIAVLVTHYKLDQLHRQGRLRSRPLVIKTEVTTELIRPITNHFGGRLIGHLLVGFKYIGDILRQLEQTGRYGDVESALDDFIVGVEESHGVLVTSDIRDKDAAGAAVLLAELAAQQRLVGATLVDYLDDIYRRYGYHANRLASTVMTGADGVANIARIQDELRRDPPQAMAGQAIRHVTDHWDETGLFGPFLSETDRASRNVLIFGLENGGRVILRPSGTEPKNKVYIEVPQPPLGEQADAPALAGQKSHADGLAQRLGDALTQHMLGIIGVRLPDFALRVSSLVPLDKRIEFAESFVPNLEEKAIELCHDGGSVASVSQWIDDALSSYGKDARGLVADALRTYLDGEGHRSKHGDGSSQRRRILQTMEKVFFSGTDDR